jgi:hypothetical protein
VAFEQQAGPVRRAAAAAVSAAFPPRFGPSGVAAQFFVAAEVVNLGHGGDRGNQYTGGKGSNDPLPLANLEHGTNRYGAKVEGSNDPSISEPPVSIAQAAKINPRLRPFSPPLRPLR